MYLYTQTTNSNIHNIHHKNSIYIINGAIQKTHFYTDFMEVYKKSIEKYSYSYDQTKCKHYDLLNELNKL